MKAAAVALATLGFYVVFFRLVVRRWGSVVRALIGRLRLEADHPVRAVDAVGKLAAAGVGQLIFALVMMLLLGVSPASIVGFQVDLMLLGAFLGIGEIALASFACIVTLQAFLTASAGRAIVGDWFARARGGWMSYFLATARTAPLWLAIPSIGLYVAVEELVFRGILVTALAQYGAVFAIVVSSALFVAVQPIGMPSARAALFPAIGAAVVGPIHGIVFWHVHDILPLIAAHLAYFAGALRLAAVDPRRAVLPGVR